MARKAAAEPDEAAQRKAAEGVAASQVALFAAGATPGSTAVDLMRQSQQGFAKIEAEAKAKAQAAKERAGTQKSKDAENRKVEAKSDDKTDKSDAASNAATADAKKADTDEDTKANIDRVTAFYLDDSEPKAPRKRAA